MSPPAFQAHDHNHRDPVHALRHATQSLHHTLDSQLPLAQADAGVPDYLAHLQTLRGWLMALGPLLQQAGWGRDYLHTVELDLPGPSPAPAGSTTAEPQPERDAAFALGVAYVVEGSQLGGQVLLRRLRQSGVSHPLRYLEGRGDATGPHWAAFLKNLRVRLDRPDRVASACDGACWAFEDLLGRFRQSGQVT